MIQFKYFSSAEAEQFTFYRIPKLLFTSDIFRPLSCEAKVLYGLMLDRVSLSMKNGWKDEEDRVYIIYAITDICEQLGCGRQKAFQMLAELDMTSTLCPLLPSSSTKPANGTLSPKQGIVTTKTFISFPPQIHIFV